MSKKTPFDMSAHNGIKNKRGISPAQRAKNYLASGDERDLGQGASRTMARVYLPQSALKDKSRDPTATDDEFSPDRSQYRKPKGFSVGQQVIRERLIREIQELTGDKTYDGVGHRLKTEEDSHRWHNVKGGATPARLSHSMLGGHGHH